MKRLPILYKNRLNDELVAEIRFIGCKGRASDYDVLVQWWSLHPGEPPLPTGVEERLAISMETWKRDWAIYKAGNSC